MPLVDTSESSLTCRRYTDLGCSAAGAMWFVGQHSWCKSGYSIGTPVKGMCLNIHIDGNITMYYDVQAREVMVDTIRRRVAEQVTLDDSVIISGNIVLHGSVKYKPVWVAGKINGANLTTISTVGRYGFTVSRVATVAAGVFTLNFIQTMIMRVMVYL